MDYGAVVLDICSKRKIENPTDGEIRAELSNLSTKEQDHFAILGTSDMTYIQISGDKDVGFILEYQDGSIHEHYKAKDEDIYLEKATEAFINFRDKNPNWKTKFDFEKETW